MQTCLDGDAFESFFVIFPARGESVDLFNEGTHCSIVAMASLWAHVCAPTCGRSCYHPSSSLVCVQACIPAKFCRHQLKPIFYKHGAHVPYSPSASDSNTSGFGSPLARSSQTSTIAPWTPQRESPLAPHRFRYTSQQPVSTWFAEAFESDGYVSESLALIATPRVGDEMDQVAILWSLTIHHHERTQHLARLHTERLRLILRPVLLASLWLVIRL